MSIAPSSTESLPDALARDSELLSSVLHEVLVEQSGEAFARTVRWLHETAAQLRDGDADAGAALAELVQQLPQADVEPCIRACALQLQLANIAEERERVRRRRHYDATGVRQRESLMEAADLLRAEGADLARRAARRSTSSWCSPRTRPRRRAARCSTTSCTSRRCSTSSTIRASAAPAAARCCPSCARR